MNFDRFHQCIISFFVALQAPLPLAWMGRTVDDVPTVVPHGAKELQAEFVREYRQQLNRLNIKAAANDPERLKAFDGELIGEVLGVWFDSEAMNRIKKKK